MTYCKQQIPDDFYIVTDLPIELNYNMRYIKTLRIKREIHTRYNNRILRTEKQSNEQSKHNDKRV